MLYFIHFWEGYTIKNSITLILFANAKKKLYILFEFFLLLLVLTIVKTGQQNSVSPLLLLHVPDAFLINGRRMNGLTEGLDNNG